MDLGQILVTLLTISGSLGGVFIGNKLSAKHQLQVFKEQESTEKRQFSRERYSKTLKIYNDFLEANGRISIAGDIENPIFRFELYKKEIRPIFYNDISCLHDDVIDWVMEIDRELSFIDFFSEGSSAEANQELIETYSKIFHAITDYVKQSYSKFE